MSKADLSRNRTVNAFLHFLISYPDKACPKIADAASVRRTPRTGASGGKGPNDRRFRFVVSLDPTDELDQRFGLGGDGL